MKKKTSIYLDENLLKKLEDIKEISGISKARFIEAALTYILENGLEKEIFFSKKAKQKELIKEEKKDTGFKIKL